MVVGYVAAGAVAVGIISEKYGLPIPNYRQVLPTTPDERTIEAQAWSMLRSKMIAEEGYRNDVYRDSLGKLTVGIGHLVQPGDNLKLGDKISDKRVDQLFHEDLKSAFGAAVIQAQQLNRYNVEMITALTSVNFQLGIFWNTAKFPNTWAKLQKGEAAAAVNSILNSEWHKQTPKRTTAFIEVIKNQYA